jgi:DNA-binding NarL/FixJ family response regulator
MRVAATPERRARMTRPAGHDPLTAFERRLLELMASGLNRTEIARAVHRSPQTISNCLTVAKEKLGARSLTQAAVLIAQRGMLVDRRRHFSTSR